MEVGFIKADSRNLPEVSVEMIVNFFVESAEFTSVEMKGTKLLRSTRESYGDHAIGYVQIKRDGELCTIKCRVTPEHKVRGKDYRVTTILNETQGLVQSCQCEDCAASEGTVSTFDGRSAALQRFPSIVQVEFANEQTFAWVQKCSGIILNNRYVLSAAKCFSGPLYSPQLRRIRAGTPTRNTGGQIVYVQREINHPRYVVGYNDHDISVVRLTSLLVYGEFVRNSPIAAPTTVLPLGFPVVQAGWGSIGSLRQSLDIDGIFIHKNSDCDLPDDPSEYSLLCGEKYRFPGTNQDLGSPWYVVNVTVALVSTTVPNRNVAATPVAPYTDWILESAV